MKVCDSGMSGTFALAAARRTSGTVHVIDIDPARGTSHGKGETVMITVARSPVALIALAAMLALCAGCTTTRTVESPTVSVQEELSPGDDFRVSLRNGGQLELSFVEATPEHLAGRDGADELRAIPWADIARLEFSQVDVGRTTLLVLAGVAVAVAAGSGSGGGY